MTKIDIFSGFLGAGKTTLIKKLIEEAYKGEQLVLIENEFGDIGIDGGFLQDADLEITEMNSGCICCSLVGDFWEALKKTLARFSPDRILIEPSGVGKLSEVITAVKNVDSHDISLNSFTAVVDASRCKMYMKNFGEFFNDQIEHANCIVLSHTDGLSEKKLTECVELLRSHNPSAPIVTTSWETLNGTQILEAMEQRNTLSHELKDMETCCPVCGHHHSHEHDHHHHEHHHEHDEHCSCGHDHHHHHEHEHREHHHEHEEHCSCGHDHHHHDHHHHEHHHHEHGEHCSCGHDHHHHHADEVFTSWGGETPKKFSEEELKNILSALEEESKYGYVLRAKGIVSGKQSWIHFDYVPGESDIRSGSASVTGRICVIGAQLKEAALKELFGV